MQVRIFCDWGSDTILWFQGALRAEELGIPGALVHRMNSWRESWLAGIDDEGGWRSQTALDLFLLEGHRIWRHLDELSIEGVTFRGDFDPEFAEPLHFAE